VVLTLRQSLRPSVPWGTVNLGIVWLAMRTNEVGRSGTSGALLVLWLVLSTIAACGPGGAAKALRPDDPTYAGAVGATSDGGARPRLLIVDWEPEVRGDLEIAMKLGVAVVAYRGGKLKLLDSCHLEGDYGFLGMTRKERLVRLEDGDEIRANLPLNGAALAAQLEGELSRGATLEVGLVMVGKRMTTARRAQQKQLEGDCDGATHFVRGATVGAFVMETGTRAKLRSAAELFGAGVSAASTSAKHVRTREGDLADCQSSDPDALAPPKQCGSPLRVELAPIDSDRDFLSADEPAIESPDIIASGCPDHLVMREGKCAAPQEGAGHQCRGIDPVDCKTQCDLDHGGSCVNLGWAYEQGIDVAKDHRKAFAAYRKSCKLGTTEGCRAVAFMYLNGLGVAADPKKALQYYQRSCNDGDALGCSNLGVMFAHGKGVSKDIDRAVVLYRRACNGGNPRGCINLGSVYEEGGGVAKDPIQAAKLYKRACIGEHPAGCVNLGHLYDEGIGVHQDRKNALSLVRRGCRYGQLEACVEIGLRYDQGDRAPEDPKLAFELFGQACAGGNLRGCANLGVMYRHGRGVTQDMSEAAALFERTCEENLACASLGELYALGKGVPKNRKRAKKLLAGPCAKGDKWACDVIKEQGL
jgi:TPR repeat protein